MFGLFRLMFLVYIAGAILLIAIGYDYMEKHHPKVNLPYKEQVFGLQNIIIDKVNKFIDNNKKTERKTTEKIDALPD
ncbi:MAG: hypothetical protein ACO2XZ_03055 [Rickettsiales bacterium]